MPIQFLRNLLLSTIAAGCASCGFLSEEVKQLSGIVAPEEKVKVPFYMVYATLSDTPGKIVSLELDPTTGFLSQKGALLDVGLGPEAIAATPDGSMVFVGNISSNDVQSFSVSESNGTLTPKQTISETHAQVKTMAFDPLGKFLFTGHRIDPGGPVTSYSLDANNKTLTEKASADSGTKTRGISVNPTGDFVYSGNWTASTITTFQVNRVTGALTVLGAIATGGCPTGQTVDPSNKFVYVSDCYNPVIVRHPISAVDGTLGAAETINIPGASSTIDVALTTDGKFLYGIDYSGSRIYCFMINSTTQVASFVGDWATGAIPIKIAVVPGNQFLIVSGFDTGVSVFRINQTTGSLTQTEFFTLPFMAPVVTATRLFR